MERAQFTFYKSFYDSICRIRKKQDKADAFDAICRYALFGEEPDLDKVPDIVAVAFINAKPNLDASRKKAESGKKGGESKQSESKPQANESNGKQPPSENENENENEIEIEIEGEKEKDKISSAPVDISPFDSFWGSYPCQIGREAARQAFRQAQKREEFSGQILEALKLWKLSEQWAEESGRFVPRAAKWLNEDHWKSPPAVKNAGASGILGQAELEAIQRVLQEA